MIRRSIASAAKGLVLAVVLSLLLCGNRIAGSANFAGNCAREMIVIFRDSDTQWMVFLCLLVYFVTFLFLRSHDQSQSLQILNKQRIAHPNLWLVAAVAVAAVVYFLNYSVSDQALTFLAGAVVGQGMAVWAGLQSRKQKVESRNGFVFLVAVLLVMLLAVASFWRSGIGPEFAYHRQPRWSGPWENPNLFGLLMGVGMVLAISQLVQSLKPKGQDQRRGIWNRKFGVGRMAVIILYLLAAVLMGRGLWHSYSRGAWVATAGGLAYLIVECAHLRAASARQGGRSAERTSAECGVRSAELSLTLWLRRNWLPLSVVALSMVVLGFWQFRQSDWLPGRRAFSAANVNDFSWRNRVAAWEGALQIMAEHPWLGAGWNQPEPLFRHYYLPPKLDESAAIEMNDYLMLDATLGVPALGCFSIYLWLCLSGKAENRKLKAEMAGHVMNAELGKPSDGAQRPDAPCPQPSSILNPRSSAWLAATCRAGAIVLAVGFWFDGGLFKLATASTFWILLELGRVELLPQKATEGTETQPATA